MGHIYPQQWDKTIQYILTESENGMWNLLTRKT